MFSIRVTSIGVLIAIAIALALVIAVTTGAAGHNAPAPNAVVDCCY
jgi:hypothetical protein